VVDRVGKLKNNDGVDKEVAAVMVEVGAKLLFVF
jgi:hypothetical protein